jgi:hypothetical protein
LIRSTGPSTLVITADVLLKAAEDGDFKHTSAGALAGVVRAIQKQYKGGSYSEETRCKCEACLVGVDLLMEENAQVILSLSESLKITQRYLLTKGSSSPDNEGGGADFESATKFAADSSPSGLHFTNSPTFQERIAALHPNTWGTQLPHLPDNDVTYNSFFAASKNGSQVFKRPATQGSRFDPQRQRRGEMYPPPWGPATHDDLADQMIDDGEKLGELESSIRLETLVDAVKFKHRADRQAWYFLLDHVVKKSSSFDEHLVTAEEPNRQYSQLLTQMLRAAKMPGKDGSAGDGKMKASSSTKTGHVIQRDQNGQSCGGDDVVESIPHDTIRNLIGMSSASGLEHEKYCPMSKFACVRRGCGCGG